MQEPARLQVADENRTCSPHRSTCQSWRSNGNVRPKKLVRRALDTKANHGVPENSTRNPILVLSSFINARAMDSYRELLCLFVRKPSPALGVSSPGRPRNRRSFGSAHSSKSSGPQLPRFTRVYSWRFRAPKGSKATPHPFDHLLGLRSPFGAGPRT